MWARFSLAIDNGQLRPLIDCCCAPCCRYQTFMMACGRKQHEEQTSDLFVVSLWVVAAAWHMYRLHEII